jgi:hypothetical protein
MRPQSSDRSREGPMGDQPRIERIPPGSLNSDHHRPTAGVTNHEGHQQHEAALGLFRQIRIAACRADRPPGREEPALGSFRQIRITAALGSEPPFHLVLPRNGFVFGKDIREKANRRLNGPMTYCERKFGFVSQLSWSVVGASAFRVSGIALPVSDLSRRLSYHATELTESTDCSESGQSPVILRCFRREQSIKDDGLTRSRNEAPPLSHARWRKTRRM